MWEFNFGAVQWKVCPGARTVPQTDVVQFIGDLSEGCSQSGCIWKNSRSASLATNRGIKGMNTFKILRKTSDTRGSVVFYARPKLDERILSGEGVRHKHETQNRIFFLNR